jgi:hypothetical protein
MSVLQTKILTLALSRYFFDGYDMMDHISGVDFNQIHRSVLKYCSQKSCYNGKSFKKVLKTIADENSDAVNKYCPKDHGIDALGDRRKLDEVRYEGYWLTHSLTHLLTHSLLLTHLLTHSLLLTQSKDGPQKS